MMIMMIMMMMMIDDDGDSLDDISFTEHSVKSGC